MYHSFPFLVQCYLSQQHVALFLLIAKHISHQQFYKIIICQYYVYNAGLIIHFFIAAVDPSCLWLPATVRQWDGRGAIWLQHMDHSSQFRHSSEPFLPHALSRLPL